MKSRMILRYCVNHLVVLCLLLLGGCADDVPHIQQSSDLDVTINLSDDLTKALSEKYPLDDPSYVGVSIREEGLETYDGQTFENVVFMAKQGYNNTNRWNSFRKVRMSETMSTVSLFYPFSFGVEPSAIEVNAIDNKDWLYANVHNVNQSNCVINTTMKHIQSGIRFTLSWGSYMGTGLVEEITLYSDNIAVSGVFNIFNESYESIVLPEDGFTFEPNVRLYQNGSKYTQLFIPITDKKDTLKIRLKVDGNYIYGEVKDFQPEIGHLYELAIKVNKFSLTLDDVVSDTIMYDTAGQPYFYINNYKVTCTGITSNIAFALEQNGNEANLKALLVSPSATTTVASPKMSGNASMTQSFNEDKSVRYVHLSDIQSDIELEFNGYVTYGPLSNFTSNGTYYETSDGTLFSKYEWNFSNYVVRGARNVFTDKGTYKFSGTVTGLLFRIKEDVNSTSVTATIEQPEANQVPAWPTLTTDGTFTNSVDHVNHSRTIVVSNFTDVNSFAMNGVVVQYPLIEVPENAVYYLTYDSYGVVDWEYGVTDVFVAAKSRRYVVEPTNAGSSTVTWGGYLSDKSCPNYSKADGSNSSLTLSTSADPSSWTSGAISEFAGYTNSGYITGIDIGEALVSFRNSSGNNSWFIPSCGEMALLYLYKSKINEALAKLGGVALEDADYWTSSECDRRSSWYINLSSGKVDNTGKLNKKKRRYLREI